MATEVKKQLPIVTIDSNVSQIPEIVAKHLSRSAQLWCAKVNDCAVRNMNRYNVFYNTPISMDDDASKYSYPEDIRFFIYIDCSIVNDTLKRILDNLERIKNYIIISNADSYKFGKYQLSCGNCTNETIADLISAIILIYRLDRRFITSEELQALMSSPSPPSSTTTQPEADKANRMKLNNNKNTIGDEIKSSKNNTIETIDNNIPIKCDLYKILDSRNVESLEIADCTMFDI